jgi:hypothetical protein
MRTTNTLIAFITLLACVCKAKDLLKNTDFEKVKNNNPVNWEFNYARKSLKTSAKVELSQEQAKSGKHSVKFYAEGDNGSYFAIRQSIRAFSPNAKLKVQADVYIEEFDSGSIKLFYFIISSAKKNYYPTLLKLTPDKSQFNKWVTYSATLDLAKFPNAKSLLFWILVAKNFEGKFYVDNVSVTEITE